MTGRKPKLGIVGAGNIGQLLAFQLAEKFDVCLISHRYSAPTEKQMSLTSLSQDISEQTFKILPSNHAAISELDIVLVCVKAYQVIEAIEPLLLHLPSHAHLILMHNGMGPYLSIVPRLKVTQGLSLATTSQGAYRDNQWHVTHSGNGLTQFGHIDGTPLSPQAKHLMLQSIPNSEWVSEILPALWQKLAINAVINPLTALHQCLNGDIALPKFQPTVQAILTELFDVAKAEGITLDQTETERRVFEVIKLTASNRSSMQQDVNSGRQTEIEYINGFIEKQAKKHSIDCPVNHSLCAEITALHQ
ncbi:ketopantoate reductase family protein [Parashewanella curva]|uniref:ketopantoate reductase family protein n=1 Tax=Parashewanella curva TaxID=2338552 RepID=UPI0014042A65|nr:2-dehydropantoate 2-reductase [Parashewanella curva]